MNPQTKEQLIYTIQNRMDKTNAHFEDRDSFVFYDMGCPEPDTHLRGFTIRKDSCTYTDKGNFLDIFRKLSHDPRNTWRVRMPSSALSSWGNFLIDQGFTPRDERGTPAMERQLPIDYSLNHSVQWAEREEEKEQCAFIISKAFELSFNTAKKILSPLSSQELAYISDDRKILSCGILSLDPSSSYGGLYYIGTDENYRGQGLGKELVTAMTNRAFEYGAKNVILQASTLGEFVYNHLGYRKVGKYQNFIHTNNK
ncbi:MAG: GNAT family N-acetyltransferase [Tissierellia bacterium]|nr:GNAT family N-acetyltransferase [Tissierellia bacterium]